MTDLAVRIAYRGEGFSGSQIQPGLRTVEGTLLSSLVRVTEMDPEDICLRLASRTDKGVNATGNVASFESGGMEPGQLLKALNSIYDGILCTAYARVDDSFLPRHADMRTYEYVMKSAGMDLGLAEECLAVFRGRHDFSGFCKSEGKDTVIDLVRADARVEDDVLVLTFQADHFLWNMIRRITSTVMRVASGRIPLSRAEEGMAGGWSNFGLAPAEGLTLTDVFYDDVQFTPSPDPALRVRRADGLYRAHLDDRFYRGL
ncbi:MAG: tRNA pseudouridine(38-40) synthase TruA [Thermoplasmata archaeon]|nr:tRNA pseudouridine(38-40) synthase TruA [Thermoplasmata archaeon]